MTVKSHKSTYPKLGKKYWPYAKLKYFCGMKIKLYGCQVFKIKFISMDTLNKQQCVLL